MSGESSAHGVNTLATWMIEHPMNEADFGDLPGAVAASPVAPHPGGLEREKYSAERLVRLFNRLVITGVQLLNNYQPACFNGIRTSCITLNRYIGRT